MLTLLLKMRTWVRLIVRKWQKLCASEASTLLPTLAQFASVLPFINNYTLLTLYIEFDTMYYG